MKVKTSVSLSQDVLEQITLYALEGERSDFIEKALYNYLGYLKRCQRNNDDLQKINAASEFLNNEAFDTLSYQISV